VFVHRTQSATQRPELTAVEERLTEIERLLREKG
jgi:hypothetical protein